MDSTAYFLLAVLAIVWIYPYIFPTFPDVHHVVLAEQSSIASLSYPGETAFYRSKVTPQGKRLITGLAIADHSTQPGSTRNGDVIDLWTILKQNVQIKTIVAEPQTRLYTTKAVSLSQLESLVYGLGQWIKNKAGDDNSTTKRTDVVVLNSNGLDSLVFFFAATLYGFSVVFVSLEEAEHINQAVRQLDPAVVIGSAEKLSELTNVNQYVTLCTTSVKKQTQAMYTAWWSELQAQFQSKTSAEPDLKQEELNRHPLKMMALDATDSPRLYSYSQSSIAASVAAQVKALPNCEEWTQEDKVLAYYANTDVYMLIAQLTAVVCGSTLLYVDQSILINDPLKIVRDIKPTILVTEELSTYSLAELAKDLTLMRELKLKWGLRSLQQNILPSSSVIPEFKSVRLIHCGYYRYAATLEDVSLTSQELNTIRCLTGARVVHALNTPVSCGPVAQTSVYDYRATREKNLISFGPPQPCLEAKLVDHGSLKARDRKGKLLIRGFCTADDDTSNSNEDQANNDDWVDTNLLGSWGIDGCFQLLDSSH